MKSGPFMAHEVRTLASCILVETDYCKMTRSTFFSERVVNVWNGLRSNVDFSSLKSFTRTVKLADLSLF